MVTQSATEFAQRDTRSTAMRRLGLVGGAIASPKVPNDLDPCILLLAFVQLESILVAVQAIVLLGWQTQPAGSRLVRRVGEGKQTHRVTNYAFLARFHLLGDIYGEAESVVYFEDK